ncbi:unnamed protein product [Rhizoctonia solani]|uniref:Uncharacterized protein n=1 Tax=Rhizoctonia solani TaxID=456999 RepID=A0A8H3AMY3_9AGAM|nr:unnamed protein product [Rhizoctonia solani]CAE6445530.1 unnamed protein product [Rhizoctonia solani]
MSTLNHNIPCFSPPIGYRHKINANAAWVRSNQYPTHMNVAPGRKLLPPPRANPELVTPWGTPRPIWLPGDKVLVQLYSPDGEWLRATVVYVLSPIEFESLSMDEIEKLPPSCLEKLFCRYTVKLDEGGNIANMWTEIEEKFLVPTFLDESLRANATQFGVGERVLVQMFDGGNERTHIGHISHIAGDKVIRHKRTWHVVPRLYKVHINALETSGHWTAESLISLELSSDGESVSSDEERVLFLPPSISGVPLQIPEA